MNTEFLLAPTSDPFKSSYTEQIKRCSDNLVRLVQSRHFLSRYAQSNYEEPLRAAIDLQSSLGLEILYATGQAKNRIRGKEKSLGIAPHQMLNGQDDVKISMYGAGLQIHAAYPIQKFLVYMPASYNDLLTELMSGSASSPNLKQLGNLLMHGEAETERLAKITWGELQEIAKDPEASVIVTMTTFAPKKGKDWASFAKITLSLISNPLGLSYLFYKKETSNRTINNNSVFFNPSQTKGGCRVASYRETGLLFNELCEWRHPVGLPFIV